MLHGIADFPAPSVIFFVSAGPCARFVPRREYSAPKSHTDSWKRPFFQPEKSPIFASQRPPLAGVTMTSLRPDEPKSFRFAKVVRLRQVS